MFRISTPQQYNTYQSDINRAHSAYYAAQQQVSTGKRISTVSDDVYGASLSINMRTMRKSIEGYVKNLSAGKNILNTTEAALQETSNLIKHASTLAIQGANAATGQNAVEGIISEVGDLQKRILDLANSRGPSGQFVFGGQKNGAAPFSVVSGVLTYGGDHNSVTIEADATTTLDVSTQGDPLFTDLYNQLETLKTNLGGGTAGAVSDQSIAQLASTQKLFDQARGEVGVRLNTISDRNDHFTRRTDELTSGISDVEDVDAASAIVNYQRTQTAYQAALQVASKGFSLSLLDYIR